MSDRYTFSGLALAGRSPKRSGLKWSSEVIKTIKLNSSLFSTCCCCYGLLWGEASQVLFASKVQELLASSSFSISWARPKRLFRLNICLLFIVFSSAPTECDISFKNFGNALGVGWSLLFFCSPISSLSHSMGRSSVPLLLLLDRYRLTRTRRCRTNVDIVDLRINYSHGRWILW